MKNFRCQCGNTVYFENHGCLACGRELGFLPEYGLLAALEPAGASLWRPLHPAAEGRQYRKCANYSDRQVCNWMIAAGDADSFCRSCRLNHVIPNLADSENQRRWYRIEKAKRRLLYTLFGLGLSVASKSEHGEEGLGFEFLQDPVPEDGFGDDFGYYQKIMTGHCDGVITINLAEADSGAREDMRRRMGERYRTLLGHFRHESGHFFWGRFFRDEAALARFRAVFGDERADYRESLERYYAGGAPGDWQLRCVSAYATSHPWEDWAETWSHYLHMVDTLETAADLGFALEGLPVRALPPAAAEPSTRAQGYGDTQEGRVFHAALHDWVRLTLAMNALNRSMGLRDAYPFVLSDAVKDKLDFVHQIVGEHTGKAA